jgi:heptaprenyl diphosphate synthase
MPLADQLDDDLRRVDQAIEEVVDEPHPLASTVMTHLLRSGGQRLRPRLAMLAGRVVETSLGDAPRDLVDAAVAAELVHLGTLHHDDVIDDSTIRRGVDTVNALWGNTVAILAGDYLLARATQVASGMGTETGRALAECICDMVRGQILESGYLFNPGRSIDDYLAAIDGKTARLMGAACWLGARVCGGDEASVAALDDYGRLTGRAYQMLDDLVDLCADAETAGKPTGVDIREGVYTMPLLLALHDRPELGESLRPGIAEEDAARVRAAVLATPGPSETVTAVARETERARQALEAVDERSEAAKHELAEFATRIAIKAASTVDAVTPTRHG